MACSIFVSDQLVVEDSVERINPEGAGDIVLVCEHASNRIPVHLKQLQLDETALQSHVAWDPGAYDLARSISHLLDAPLIASTVSRLVYDCNRPPTSATAMPMVSEQFNIPGNRSMTEADRSWRINEVYRPFHGAVQSVLDAREAQRRLSVLVTMHSFTPVFNGEHRQVELGILHDTDTRLADELLTFSARLSYLDVRRNEPYGPDDGVTHTLQQHGTARGILNVMLEMRNDLLTDGCSIEDYGEVFSDLITDSVKACLARYPECRPEIALSGGD